MSEFKAGDVYVFNATTIEVVVPHRGGLHFYSIRSNAITEHTCDEYKNLSYRKLGNISCIAEYMYSEYANTHGNLHRNKIAALPILPREALPVGNFFLECLSDGLRLVHYIGLKFSDDSYLLIHKNGNKDSLNAASSVLDLGPAIVLLAVLHEYKLLKI